MVTVTVHCLGFELLSNSSKNYFKFHCKSLKLKHKFQFIITIITHILLKANKYHKQNPYTYSEHHIIQFTTIHLCTSPHTVNSFLSIDVPALASFSGCSFTSVHNLSMLVPLQVLLQRNALFSNTLASLWLRGWWNSLRKSLVAGSIGPRFLSAARRVLDMGRLVSATSTCSDRGPARRMGAESVSLLIHIYLEF